MAFTSLAFLALVGAALAVYSLAPAGSGGGCCCWPA